MIGKPHCHLVIFNSAAVLTPPRGNLTLVYDADAFGRLTDEFDAALTDLIRINERVNNGVLSDEVLMKLGLLDTSRLSFEAFSS